MVMRASHPPEAAGPTGTPIEQLAVLRAAIGHASRGDPVIALHHPAACPTRPGEAAPAGCSCGQPACPTPAEHPIPIRGLHHATCDLLRITAWWGRDPAANLGLATGHRFDALSTDGPTGHAALARLPGTVGPAIQTGGGRLVFLVVATGQPSGRLPAGEAGLLVFRHAAGSVIVAPPGRHGSGRAACWITPHTLSLPDPAQILDALGRARARRSPTRRSGLPGLLRRGWGRSV